MSQGLIRAKYRVEKVDDPDHKHDECEFFVLDPLHDPAARDALVAYAIVTDNDQLREDLFEWVDRVNAQE